MSNTLKKLKKTARALRLSTEERSMMREALVRHMKMHPAKDLASSVSPFSLFDIKKKKTISLFVIGGMLMGGTVSFAAEGTAPGDILYPVKVHVNEPVRGVVAISSKAKAEWEVRLVERRLEEVEKLNTSPDVSPEAQKIAEANVEQYAERVKSRIAQLEQDADEEDVMSTTELLSDTLRRHEETLSRIEEEHRNQNIGIATTTENVIRRDNELIQGAIEKVRETRDHAEKRNKELKKKYQEGGINNESNSSLDKDVRTSTENNGEDTNPRRGVVAPSSVSSVEDITNMDKGARSNVADRQKERFMQIKKESQEELRSTPVSSEDGAEKQKEAKKEDKKTRIEN